MKKLLVLLFSLFLLSTTSVFADDISDFSIEGISIGDSLLDHLSYKEIINSKLNYHEGERQYYPVSGRNLKLKDFDLMEFYLRTNDNNFIIEYMVGAILYINNSDSCITKKHEIVGNVLSFLPNADMTDEETTPHPYDQSGKSTQTQTNFLLNSGYISVDCKVWSYEIKHKHPDWTDNLGLIVSSYEFNEWVINGYK